MTYSRPWDLRLGGRRQGPIAGGGPWPDVDLPLRLPAGWTRRRRIGPYSAAFGDTDGAAILYVTTGEAPTPEQLPKAYDECLVLDTSTEKCRGGLAAQRILSSYREAGKPFTSEHWSVEHGGLTHVFTAIMPTLEYPRLCQTVARAIKSFPGKGYATAPQASLSKRTGVHAIEVADGHVVVDHDTGRAAVLLPGMSSVRIVSPALVPGWIAALTGLGPRPALPRIGRLLTDPDTLERLLAGREVGPGAWAAHLARIQLAQPRRWSLGTSEIVDAGDAGLWHIGGDEQTRVLTPTTTSWVWRLLTENLARHTTDGR